MCIQTSWNRKQKTWVVIKVTKIQCDGYVIVVMHNHFLSWRVPCINQLSFHSRIYPEYLGTQTSLWSSLKQCQLGIASHVTDSLEAHHILPLQVHSLQSSRFAKLTHKGGIKITCRHKIRTRTSAASKDSDQPCWWVWLRVNKVHNLRHNMLHKWCIGVVKSEATWYLPLRFQHHSTIFRFTWAFASGLSSRRFTWPILWGNIHGLYLHFRRFCIQKPSGCSCSSRIALRGQIWCNFDCFLVWEIISSRCIREKWAMINIMYQLLQQRHCFCSQVPRIDSTALRCSACVAPQCSFVCRIQPVFRGPWQTSGFQCGRSHDLASFWAWRWLIQKQLQKSWALRRKEPSSAHSSIPFGGPKHRPSNVAPQLQAHTFKGALNFWNPTLTVHSDNWNDNGKQSSTFLNASWSFVDWCSNLKISSRVIQVVNNIFHTSKVWMSAPTIQCHQEVPHCSTVHIA